MINLKSIATLAPVAVGAAALMQVHWLVGHFGTIALIAGAVTGGAALLVGKAKGKGKQLEQEQEDAEAVVNGWQPPSLPKATTAYVVDPAAVKQKLHDLAR